MLLPRNKTVRSRLHCVAVPSPRRALHHQPGVFLDCTDVRVHGCVKAHPPGMDGIPRNPFAFLITGQSSLLSLKRSVPRLLGCFMPLWKLWTFLQYYVLLGFWAYFNELDECKQGGILKNVPIFQRPKPSQSSYLFKGLKMLLLQMLRSRSTVWWVLRACGCACP